MQRKNENGSNLRGDKDWSEIWRKLFCAFTMYIISHNKWVTQRCLCMVHEKIIFKIGILSILME